MLSAVFQKYTEIDYIFFLMFWQSMVVFDIFIKVVWNFTSVVCYKYYKIELLVPVKPQGFFQSLKYSGIWQSTVSKMKCCQPTQLHTHIEATSVLDQFVILNMSDLEQTTTWIITQQPISFLFLTLGNLLDENLVLSVDCYFFTRRLVVPNWKSICLMLLNSTSVWISQGDQSCSSVLFGPSLKQQVFFYSQGTGE